MRLIKIFFILTIFCVLISGCSARNQGSLKESDVDGVRLWSKCSPKDIEKSENVAAEKDLSAQLQNLSCLAYLSANENNSDKALKFTQQGRELATEVIKNNPQNGLAHYLAAYLAGRNAELKPLNGLDLVKVIEQEALRTVELSPNIDYGGADRMLGELYLKAPEPPVSIGDLDKSLEHYKKSVKEAPDYVQNRLGLASAYLEDENERKACDQYNKILDLEPDNKILENKIFQKLRSACSNGESSRK